eukprot:1182957-Pleurochrysis_carterae.AAC.1
MKVENPFVVHCAERGGELLAVRAAAAAAVSRAPFPAVRVRSSPAWLHGALAHPSCACPQKCSRA